MSSISMINCTAAAASCLGVSKNDGISEETRRKMIVLGLDPSPVKTEAEALALIQQAQAAQSQNNAGSNHQHGNSSESDIMSSAKILASDVGVSVGSNDKVDDVFDNIETKISKLMQEAKDDPAKIKTVEGFQSRLNKLTADYESMQNSQAGIFNAMNMVAVSNKFALGLS